MTIFSDPRLLNSARWKNMRVGILGGSFNPPHKGHTHISKIALKSLRLDVIWWLVTPRNPLKANNDLLPIQERIDLSKKIVDHPRILVTGLETQFQTKYSYASIKKLKEHFPNTDFAWITGIDNAHSLHHWNNWKEILSEICVVHVTRHPPIKLIRHCPVRMLSTQKHIVLDRGGYWPLDSRTTYWLLHKKMVNISSTDIRKISSLKTVA